MHHDFATTAGDTFVTEHRAFDLAATDGRLDQHFGIETQCQPTAAVYSASSLTLLTPTEEPWFAGLTNNGKPSLSAISANPLRHGSSGQGHEGRDRQPGIAQQTFADVLVHAHRRTEHIGADKRQVGHAQQPLQATVFTEGPVDNREDHIDMAQQFLTGGFDQVLQWC